MECWNTKDSRVYQNLICTFHTFCFKYGSYILKHGGWNEGLKRKQLTDIWYLNLAPRTACWRNSHNTQRVPRVWGSAVWQQWGPPPHQRPPIFSAADTLHTHTMLHRWDRGGAAGLHPPESSRGTCWPRAVRSVGRQGLLCGDGGATSRMRVRVNWWGQA